VKTILVTGATDGIGRQAAKQLVERGARVLVHGRTPAKAEAAAKELGGVAVAGDFARLGEVRALAAEVRRLAPTLDVLVNNAGIYARERIESAEGFELTLAVNQLAPFLLTHLLIETIPAGGRIVFVSSNVHRSAGPLDFDGSASEWDGYSAYADSNVATAFELARRLADRHIAVNAMHPGVIGTKLLHRGFGGAGGAPVDRGAAGEVKLAIDPALDGVTGRYFDQTEESNASAAAQDRAVQQRVYDACLQRTGATAV
jgi:NAD(P)-dependent dehydrogenase (short-subunit alcohol dehydrogenase family)